MTFNQPELSTGWFYVDWTLYLMTLNLAELSIVLDNFLA